MAKRRRGRGRLNRIDQLPEEADEHVAWARQALTEREMHQTDILDELNRRLATLDPPVKPISASGFNRYSMGFALQARTVMQAREMAATFAEKIEDGGEGDIGLLVGETVKTLINDILMGVLAEGGMPDMGLLRTAAEAVERLEKARATSHRTTVMSREHVNKRAAEAVEDLATELTAEHRKSIGLTADTVEAIKRKILFDE